LIPFLSFLSRAWNKAANFHDDFAKGEDGEPTKFIDVGEKSEEEELEEIERKIKVFDRFTIILQIFAKRAKTRIAKLQVLFENISNLTPF